MAAPIPEHPLTFWGVVEQRAALTPDAVMLEDDAGHSMTFGEYRRRAEEVAAALFARGITSGSVVSWQIPTTIEAAVLMAALARLDAVQNPIIPIMREREVTFITRRSEDRPRDRADDVPRVQPPRDARDDRGDAGFRDPRLRRWVAERRPVDVASRAVVSTTRPSLPARWLYHTSGSTGDPKGVWHTDASVMAGSYGFIAGYTPTPDDVYPSGLPDHAHRRGRDRHLVAAHRLPARPARRLRRGAKPARHGRARGDAPRQRDPVLPGVHGRAAQARSGAVVPAAALVRRRWRPQLARAPSRGAGGTRWARRVLELGTHRVPDRDRAVDRRHRRAAEHDRGPSLTRCADPDHPAGRQRVRARRSGRAVPFRAAAPPRRMRTPTS